MKRIRRIPRGNRCDKTPDSRGVLLFRSKKGKNLYFPTAPFFVGRRLHHTFVHLFLFNAGHSHHRDDLLPVLKRSAPCQSAPRRDSPWHRNDTPRCLMFLTGLLHRHRIRGRMEGYNQFQFFFSHVYSITTSKYPSFSLAVDFLP